MMVSYDFDVFLLWALYQQRHVNIVLHELGTLRVRQNTTSFHNLYCPTTCFNVGIKIKNIHVKHH